MYHDCERRGWVPYRSRKGMVFGVCRGLAEQLNISVGATRIITLVALLMTGFWPVGALYLLAAVIMNKEPALVPVRECRREPEYRRPVSSARLNDTFDSLDHRLQRIEDVVTSKGYDWDERLARG